MRQALKKIVAAFYRTSDEDLALARTRMKEIAQ
jgi:hypothetical protein